MPLQHSIDPMNSATAVAYVRASTDEQTLTIERQQEEILVWAKINAVTVARFFVDAGVSGSAPLESRKAMLELLAHVDANKTDFVLVQRRDRIARDVFVSIVFERHVTRSGARVLALGETVEDSPQQTLMIHILNAYAEFEKRLISARTKAALAQASKNAGYSVNSRAYERTTVGREVLTVIALACREGLGASEIVGKLSGLRSRKTRRSPEGHVLTERDVVKVLRRFDRDVDFFNRACDDNWEEQT